MKKILMYLFQRLSKTNKQLKNYQSYETYHNIKLKINEPGEILHVLLSLSSYHELLNSQTLHLKL